MFFNSGFYIHENEENKIKFEIENLIIYTKFSTFISEDINGLDIIINNTFFINSLEVFKIYGENIKIIINNSTFINNIIPLR
jgi:hypothetical protein